MNVTDMSRELYGVAPPAGFRAVGYVAGNPRLGIPPLILSDGPAGVRDRSNAPRRRPGTALPAPVGLAASFDPVLAREYGELLGKEARARGVSVVYAPAINIVRVPLGGRNFEYLGEDPYLASELVSPEVTGIQAQHVAAQVKHYALNDQENDRSTASSNASERVIREMYLPAFQAAVQRGHTWSIMCANNKVNGTYACENSPLLADILRKEWKFDGVVGSDYAATHSAKAALRAGLDQSFTLRNWGAYYQDLPRLVHSGAVSEALVKDAAGHVLTLMFRVGLFDKMAPAAPTNVSADGAFARSAAEEAAVLLKNAAHALPLDPAKQPSLAVIGPYAKVPLTGGGGSSHVRPYYSVSPLDGLRARLGSHTTVTFADGSNLAAATATARAAAAAVVVVGDQEQEGADRVSLSLPNDQDRLVAAVAAANPKTVVVLQTGGPVMMPWLSRVPAVLEAWYPGQEDGNALAALLVGDVNPSGKLPVTFPTSLSQGPAHASPSYPAGPHGYDYTEGLQVGYRWYDAQHLTPLFPFGYGLSYTTFRISRLRTSMVPTVGAGTAPTGAGAGQPLVRATVAVTNTGSRVGTDVIQLYVTDPRSAGEPPRQLRGFSRIRLQPTESKEVTFTVESPAFATWNPAQHRWDTAKGNYGISVGDSSRDLPATGTVDLR
jgi:beta-glucosidase